MSKFNAIEAYKMMEKGKVMEGDNGVVYKVVDGSLLSKTSTRDSYSTSHVLAEVFLKMKFTDYAEPLKFEEGEMYVFESHDNEKWYAVHKEVDGNQYWTSLAVVVAKNFVVDKGGYFNKRDGKFHKPTDEELEEFERFMVFHKKGREMDEFELGDIVEREDALYIVVVQTEDNKFEHVIGCVEINDDDAPVKYFPASDVELRFCVEDAAG
ncbi:hypothetical protein [Bacillus cytotoxicus]|uniref:Uncharacterized protein n=1 Tax=Bacillus cytotoxicus TaxID=580165 RepID=A0AAX2CKS3_9BACI|nr:hypothetical protein [Bacillus cytotoxicus]SCM00583.1 Uncharacterized protein BCB44BAC_03337 [Bacillus cytotoxicus]